MEKSLRFDTVKRHYDNNAWDKSQVADAVGRWITAEEYQEITGEDYKAPAKPLTEQEQAILDTAVNTEYLVCLADMGM